MPTLTPSLPREKALANQSGNSTNLDLSAVRQDPRHLDDIPENNSDYEDEEEEDEEAEFVEVYRKPCDLLTFFRILRVLR